MLRAARCPLAYAAAESVSLSDTVAVARTLVELARQYCA